MGKAIHAFLDLHVDTSVRVFLLFDVVEFDDLGWDVAQFEFEMFVYFHGSVEIKIGCADGHKFGVWI